MRATKQITRLRSALKELQAFRRFFSALPASAINLDIVMMNPRTTSTIPAIELTVHANAPRRCGSVGCLMGWAMAWAERTLGPHSTYSSRLGLHLLRPETHRQYAYNFSGTRQRPRMSQRAEALARLTQLRKGLTLDLAHATKRSRKA